MPVFMTLSASDRFNLLRIYRGENARECHSSSAKRLFKSLFSTQPFPAILDLPILPLLNKSFSSKSSFKMLAKTALFFATALGAVQAATYKASFTEYGAGDSFGSPNCNTNTVACGFYSPVCLPLPYLHLPTQFLILC
jgi:hypothetical protein